MKDPHFVFQQTSKDGNPIGLPVECFTEEGVIMQCDPRIKQSKVRHLCAIARQADGGPVDITHFDEYSQELVWSARIHYTEGNHGHTRDIFK